MTARPLLLAWLVLGMPWGLLTGCAKDVLLGEQLPPNSGGTTSDASDSDDPAAANGGTAYVTPGHDAHPLNAGGSKFEGEDRDMRGAASRGATDVTAALGVPEGPPHATSNSTSQMGEAEPAAGGAAYGVVEKIAPATNGGGIGSRTSGADRTTGMQASTSPVANGASGS